MIELKELIRPELLILVPVLYFIGNIIKKMKNVNNYNIPLILGLIGIFISFIYCFSVTPIKNYMSILQIFFSSITQGILCAGSSVYFHQLFVVQKSNKKE